MSDRIQLPKTNCQLPPEKCLFKFSEGEMTCVGILPPIYNSEGENIYPDTNIHGFKLECQTCGRVWNGTSRGLPSHGGETVFIERRSMRSV